MRALSSDAGKRALQGVRRGSLLAFDFDGTLLPIVDHADEAFLPTEIAHKLRALTRQTPVAILSGRSCRDLRPRLGFQPTYLFGNHGLEGPGFVREAKQAARLVKVWRGQLPAGPHVEDKVYSLTLHYRLATNRAQARARLLREISRLKPLPRVITGKCTLNLLPAEGIDKGSAMKRLLKRTPGMSIFIGDDDTDEEALKIKDRRLITIRVGRHRHSRAAFYVRHPQDVWRLLDQLLEQTKRAPGA